jgi:ABC-type multidrug transport system fused ATPase/permease subunit
MSAFLQKAQRIYNLAAPYGRRKMLLVFLVALAQGIFQVIGVTSIFPFLALAANPGQFMNSELGQTLLRWLPEITERQLLLVAGLFAILALLSANAVMLLGEVARARYVAGLGHWLRVRLLSQMVNNPYGYFLHHNTGELLKKASADVMSFIGGILAPLMDFLARLIMVILLLATLLWINLGITLVAGLILVGFYVLVYKILGRMRKATSDGLKAANRGAMKEALQVLSGIKPIKVHGVERFFIRRYGGFTAMQARLAKWIPVVNNSPRYLIEPIAFGGIVGVVIYYVVLGQSVQSILPVLGVMALAGYRLLPNIQLMYGAFSGISISSHALEEIYDEIRGRGFQHPLVFPDPFAASGPKPIRWEEAIELKDITFHYKGAKTPVLDGMNLRIPKNHFYAFIGETGSGKSTLIDLILGLHEPSGGQILVDGIPLTPERMRSWRAGIGYVPQDIFLMDDTISANIAFGVPPEEIEMERVHEVAKAAQLRRFISEELPDGFATKVGERGVRLSGGQRQRIGLARALYHEPALLILDEATSALDNQTEAALMEAIESLHGKLSLLVIAHRLTTVRRADKVIQLAGGGVAREGTYAEIVPYLPEEEVVNQDSG